MAQSLIFVPVNQPNTVYPTSYYLGNENLYFLLTKLILYDNAHDYTVSKHITFHPLKNTNL